MTKEEKIKAIWDKCVELAPNPMDMVKVGYNRTLRHYYVEGNDYFAIVGPQSKVLALIKKDSMTNADIASAMISLGFWDTDDIADDLLTPIEQLLAELEALKQLPDDTAASYIKGQLSESLERYFAKRN